MLLSSPRIKNMYEFYRWIEYALTQSSDSSLKFVIKEHPSDLHKDSDLYYKIVVTINSSVGLEALLLHKLVIVLGEACFGIEGLSHQLSSMKELSVTVNKLSSSQPDVVLIEHFLYYLGRESCVPGS